MSKEKKMEKAYIVADNIISSLGFTSAENFGKVKAGVIGIKPTYRFQNTPDNHTHGPATGKTDNPSEVPVSGGIALGSVTGDGGQPDYASLTDMSVLDNLVSAYVDTHKYTPLEKMAILSVHTALKGTRIDPSSKETLFVVSTAKGNIDLIDKNWLPHIPVERLFPYKFAETITGHFGNPNRPVTISNACISGTLALIFAQRALAEGFFKNAVVVGADIASKFTVAGFNCLKATDNGACRPFDADRKGLNIGEGAATIVLSIHPQTDDEYVTSIVAGASSNDANHISGPSRTGEGLYLTIREILEKTAPQEISFINAHGTGTLYNDEMESIAFSRSLSPKIPVNSFKGYFGHTLGASGVIETVLSSRSLLENCLIKTAGFEKQVTSMPLNIIRQTVSTPLQTCLKTSSGFGGSNASLLLAKTKNCGL